ncbi:variable surface protein [Plasmodium gonderi]|uniref:Variable surface protein n=1 Tax=Plasmodium gonderi TaxID=77519 RepID=A0A1Y1J941_PLAGO|nr:variable surface protein [Plasmodium gonderi]GAW79031.1 variable surface protein [Plasmodium gonderi]
MLYNYDYFYHCQYINSFYVWDEIVNNTDKDDSVYKGPCANIKIKGPYGNKLSDENICKQTMLFLKEIRSIVDLKREVIGCKHIFYWLYQKIPNELNKYELTKTAYNTFVNLYKSYVEDVCTNYKEINITNDEIDKLDSIYEYYTCLNIIKKVNTCSEDIRACILKFNLLNAKYMDNCVSNNNQKFCEELVFLSNQFNEKVKALNCANTEHVLIFSYQKSNAKNRIIIAIVVVLLTSFLLVNLYKFTPYGVLLRRVLKGRTNVFNNEKEEWNIFQLPEINNSASANNVYNITYKST